MARPSAPIINKTTLDDGFTDVFLTEALGLYVVCYQGKPFNCYRQGYEGRRYQRTAFTNLGSALLLCRKLSGWFKSDDFDVRVVGYKDLQ